MAERLLLAGAGNAEKGINAINPRFQAEALRRIRGRDIGILDNSFYTTTSEKGVSRTANSNFMWKLSASNVSDIAVGRGMATAYGYDLQSEQTVHLVGTAATTGTKYIFVYLEWDLHNPDEAYGSINLYDNGSSSSWTPVSQDNLITNPTGIYQMPLYRLAVNTAGTVTATASWTALGVETIGYPLRSQYAGRAEEADHADNATAATTATNYNATSGNIKSEFDSIKTRLTNLGFKSGVVSFCGTNYGSTSNTDTSSNGVFRQGNYVIGNINVTRSFSAESYRNYISLASSPIFALPVNFRPKKAVSFSVAMVESTRPSVAYYFTITIGTDGNAYTSDLGAASGAVAWNYDQVFKINFGFEAPAIN